MNNRTVIKKAFEEVHVSQNMLEKIKSMDTNTSNIELEKRKRLRKKVSYRYISYIAAAVVLCLLASNLISYMMNGRVWIAENDENSQTESEQIDYSELPDSFDIHRDVVPSDSLYPSAKIVNDKDRLNLIIDEIDVKIDVTDNIVSGYCSGEFTVDGVIYQYEIELSDGVFDVKISKVEE